MSTALLGEPRSYLFKNETYLVCPADFHVESIFAEWVKTQAGIDLWRCKSKWPPDLYAEQNRLLNAKIVGKQFEWGKEDVHNAAWSDAGQRELLWLKMKRGEEKGGAFIEREKIDEIAQDADKWNELLMILYEQDFPDFFAYLQSQTGSAKKTALSPSPQSPFPASQPTTTAST